MTLSMAPKDQKLMVHKITGRDDVRRFLANLGFVEGAQVYVVSELNGNIIINIKETRVAIDKTLSNRILVNTVGA